MAIASFEAFCASISELIGVQPPSLAPDPMGNTGFTVTYRDARIGFLRAERGGEQAVLILVEFGAPQPGQELQTLRALLDSNYLMLDVGAPSFARNPLSGDISLNY